MDAALRAAAEIVAGEGDTVAARIDRLLLQMADARREGVWPAKIVAQIEADLAGRVER